MKPLIFDKKFKRTFREISANNKEKLLCELLNVFDLPDFHFSKSVLHRYYRKFPELHFDKNIANAVLRNFFRAGAFYILDYDEPYFGGYSKTFNPSPNEDELINDPEKLKITNSNWNNFLIKLKQNYWEDARNEKRFLSIANFDLFEQRNPISAKEKFLSTTQVIKVEEKTFLIKYNFFNVTEVLKFYDKLISEFYPDFILLKNVSNKKIKRYVKKIQNNIFLCLFIDYSFLENELNNTYLELPNIKIEILSEEMKGFIKEDLYLIGNEDYPIARIDLNYFMGAPIYNRIGNSSEDAEFLKKDLFFYSEVYSFYLTKYLKIITENLEQIEFV